MAARLLQAAPKCFKHSLKAGGRKLCCIIKAMGQITTRLRPTSGFAHFLHLGLLALLPALIFVMVRTRFYQPALAVILLSKWRMLAVRPRYWPANIRQNAVDIMVGVSALVFMINSGTAAWQLFWAVMYGLWLVFLKPRSSVLMVSLQAFIAQFAALVALFLAWVDAPLVALAASGWLICYLAARHFFSSFDEAYNSLFSYTWGYFAAALMWVLGHWLLFYGSISQPALLLSVLGFGFAALYYLEEKDRLSTLLRRQFVFIMVAIVVVVLVFSDWGDKTV